MKIILDAGHGLDDTGAAHGGYLEKDINLIVAKRVRELMKDYSPAMTRTTDTLLLWNDRAAMIKDRYDICVSFHLNAGGGTGVEAIHSHFSLRGKEIATSIVESIHELTGIPKRPKAVYSRRQANGQDYYYMHRLTGKTTTVIVEALFLDSDQDKNLLNIEKISRAIAQGLRNYLNKQVILPSAPPVKVGYTLKRMFQSNLHIFHTSESMHVDIDLGIRNVLEKTSTIANNTPGVVCATNGGFFNLNGSSEHLGMYIDEGLYYKPPSLSFVDFIYYKTGRTEIRNMVGYDQIELSRLQRDSYWAIGTSYALVKDGLVNLMLSEKFSHSTTKQPRTMLGQKADGTFVLVVADGRSSESLGLTAKEQAEVMLDLGCINAVNLDGGGSSTMVVGGKVINKPSDGVERKVGSVILVKGV